MWLILAVLRIEAHLIDPVTGVCNRWVQEIMSLHIVRSHAQGKGDQMHQYRSAFRNAAGTGNCILACEQHI